MVDNKNHFEVDSCKIIVDTLHLACGLNYIIRYKEAQIKTIDCKLKNENSPEICELEAKNVFENKDQCDLEAKKLREFCESDPEKVLKQFEARLSMASEREALCKKSCEVEIATSNVKFRSLQKYFKNEDKIFADLKKLNENRVDYTISKLRENLCKKNCETETENIIFKLIFIDSPKSSTENTIAGSFDHGYDGYRELNPYDRPYDVNPYDIPYDRPYDYV